MLVMMALSKLAIKTIDRPNLFYNKFSYKIDIHNIPMIHHLKKCTNIIDYLEEVDARYIEWESTKDRYPNGWYRNPISPADVDVPRIEQLIQLMQQYNDKSQVMYRKEHKTVIVYTSELTIIEKFAKLTPRNITYISLSPEVMFFKRTPPAKYRAYVTNNQMPADFKENFMEYLKRTPDVKISSAFHSYFTRRWNRLWDRYYVDYDDEKNLMMMMLMFPNMIGKKFKLEKK